MAYYAEAYAQQGLNMGFDTSKAPDEQESTQKDEDGNALTWAEVFKDSAANYAQFVYAYYNEAVKAGYKLSDDEAAEINETIEEDDMSESMKKYKDYIGHIHIAENPLDCVADGTGKRLELVMPRSYYRNRSLL